jgi:Fic family protein
MMVVEAIKTSEIEGEFLSRKDVASSIRNNLGLVHQAEEIKDLRAKGIAELMIDVHNSYTKELTEQKVFLWHRALLSHTNNILVGGWRTHEDPMQIVSGAMGKEKVHFEAPPSDRIPLEMTQFINWFNSTAPVQQNAIRHAPIRAAVAHIYFESIHPFEDGNGRIGRTLAEKALAQTTGHPQLISLSAAIEKDKKAYYQALEKAQRSNEITDWVIYFVDLIVKAQEYAQELINFTLQKTKYFDRFKDQLNSRQLKVINRMLSEGVDGFEGGMNAAKYKRIAKTSKATATRDLQGLLELGAITIEGQGRSTRYHLNLTR